MAKVVLIKASDISHYRPLMPPWVWEIGKNYNFAMTPPLGIMSIASVLRNKGHEVGIIDMRETELKNQSLKGEIEKHSPEIVGISAITTEAPSLHAIAKVAKEVDKKTFVIAGGPHASSFIQKVLSDPNIDCAVIGEGEEIAQELVDAIVRKRDIGEVKGIAFRKNGGVLLTPPRPYIHDLDALPFPAWDLVDLNLYGRFRSMASVGLRKYMTIFTSRACPYQCIYCHNLFGKIYRTRSPENVLQEMEILVKDHGVEEVEILDDIFNLDIPRAHAICDLIIKKKLKIGFSFPNALRGDRLPTELLRKFKDAGLNFTSIAVETASPRLQKLIKKNLNLNKVSEAIKELHHLRVFTRGFFMLGFPTETREEMLATIRFAMESELPSAMFFIVTPFEGTEVEKQFRERIQEKAYSFTGYDYFTAPFNLSRESTEEVQKLQRYAIFRFNMNPWRLYQIVSTFPRKHHLYVYAISLVKTFFIQKSERNIPHGKESGLAGVDGPSQGGFNEAQPKADNHHGKDTPHQG